MSDTPDSTPSRPILILVPRSNSTPGAGPVILGLSLGERARLAAKRAGFAQEIDLTAGTPLPPASGSLLVLAAVEILAEVSWLKAAAASSLVQWGALGDRLILIPPSQAAAAIEALRPGDANMGEVIPALTQRLGTPGSLPPGIDPMIVAGPADYRPAERRLLRALVKDTDGFMARHFDRPISLAVSRRLASTSITPNQMTLISVVIGLIGAPFFLSAQPLWQTIGALLFLAHSVLDGCDGELARLKFRESRWGGVLDFWGDNVVHSAIFACIGIGWSWANGAGWPLLLGAAAVFGTLGSASLVYWRTMRPKTGTGPLYTSVAKEPGKRFSQVLDALSRRDFIYGVVVLALFGWVKYFLLLSAIGAPGFFFALIYLARKESRP
jgi:phosphatidylglycerophosphate synthase